MGKGRWAPGLALALLLSSAPVCAAVVIYEGGKTVPLEPYLSPLQSEYTKGTTDENKADASYESLSIETLLPIRTPEMMPGTVVSRPWASAPNVFFRPVFLIGSDPYSQQWLTENRNYLQEIGAVGLLVQADSLEDLEIIKDLSQGIEIMPASGSDIARSLKLKHYPVLITREGISQ